MSSAKTCCGEFLKLSLAFSHRLVDGSVETFFFSFRSLSLPLSSSLSISFSFSPMRNSISLLWREGTAVNGPIIESLSQWGYSRANYTNDRRGETRRDAGHSSCTPLSCQKTFWDFFFLQVSTFLYVIILVRCRLFPVCFSIVHRSILFLLGRPIH